MLRTVIRDWQVLEGLPLVTARSGNGRGRGASRLGGCTSRSSEERISNRLRRRCWKERLHETFELLQTQDRNILDRMAVSQELKASRSEGESPGTMGMTARMENGGWYHLPRCDPKPKVRGRGRGVRSGSSREEKGGPVLRSPGDRALGVSSAEPRAAGR